MKIELFLRSINQEYPDKNIENQTKEFSERRWAYDWNNWPTNWAYQWSNNYAPEGKAKPSNYDLLLRKENFGGLCYDPNSTAVFRLDKEGYNFLNNLLTSQSVEKACSMSSTTIEDTRLFIMLLGKYGLWIN